MGDSNVAPAARPEPQGVADLYSSRFVDRYDRSARIWEAAACRRALAAFNERLLLLPKRPLRVLDVGCGTGRNLGRLATAGTRIESYLGVDTSARMLHHARSRGHDRPVRFVRAEAMDTLRQDNAFDLILVTWVLSHHAEPENLIDAAIGALAPGGRQLVLCLTATDTLIGRAHGRRFRRFLHANPIDPAMLHNHTPSFLSVSCQELITMAEIPSRKARPAASGPRG